MLDKRASQDYHRMCTKRSQLVLFFFFMYVRLLLLTLLHRTEMLLDLCPCTYIAKLYVRNDEETRLTTKTILPDLLITQVKLVCSWADLKSAICLVNVALSHNAQSERAKMSEVMLLPVASLMWEHSLEAPRMKAVLHSVCINVAECGRRYWPRQPRGGAARRSKPF